LVAVLAAVLLGSIVGCAAPGTSSAPPDKMTGAPTGTASDASAAASTTGTAPGSEPIHVSAYKVIGNEQIKVVTNRGTFAIKLYPKSAPNTVATFLELASSKFYDGIKFHRVEPGFVVQAGDPQTKDPSADPQQYGTGGPGFRLGAEFNANKHETGTVAMARTQEPDSAGSQFYITLAPQPMLDNQYTVFGQITSGMDVVKAIKVGDTIKSMTIVRAP
jgi:cyclophilin family peptidyl-prolyl cis-trans isomerase